MNSGMVFLGFYLVGVVVALLITLGFHKYLENKYRLTGKQYLDKATVKEIVFFSVFSWFAFLHVIGEWVEEIRNEDNL